MIKQGGITDMTERLNSKIEDNIFIGRRKINKSIPYVYFRNDKDVEWAKLLCDIGDIDDFNNILKTSESGVLAIMKYRRMLSEDRAAYVSFIEINKCYTSQRYDKLHKLLEQLFIEPITDAQMNFILKKLNSKGNGLQKLYDKHTQNTNLRVMSVVMRI